jgi:uncharacterized protein (TIGR02231 family)
MKKLLPILAFLIPFATALDADTLDVASTVDTVTVYQGVAKVTRTFEVDLQPNVAAKLRFSGLPSNVNSSYVQVAVTDGAALNLGLVTFQNEYKDSDHSQTLKDLEAKARELVAKQALLNAERGALDDFAKSRAALVVSINNGIAKTGSKELYELSKSAYDDAAAAVKDAFTKQAALDESIRVVGEEITVAKDAVEKQQKKEEATSAKYAVDALSAGGKTKGTISYYVAGPSWAPSYIVKADTAKGIVSVSYLAKVLQQTGEDWNGVTLFLETSKPGAGAKPEEPNAVFLKQMMPAVVSRSYVSKSIAAEEDAGSRGYEAELSSGIPEQQVSVESRATGFRAQIPGHVMVLSDADNATVLPLINKDIACEFHTETIPISAETAFLVGKMKNAFPLPLLAGEMQAVVDGSTNGTGNIEQTLPGEELTIGLGVNQNVVVERKIVAEKGKAGGIFGGKRVEARNYVNKITNHMTIPQRVVVRDLIPISKDDKIVVEVLQPKDAKIDPEKGLFDQEVTLKPGESIELPTQFKVTYPSDWKISGGY